MKRYVLFVFIPLLLACQAVEDKSSPEIQPEVIEQLATPDPEPQIEEDMSVLEFEESTLFGNTVVLVERKAFVPNKVTIAVGTDVQWDNVDDRNHLVIEDLGGFYADLRYPLKPGEKVTHTFANPGRFDILDANFGSRMTITVE